jgi:ribosomal protein L29
MATQYNDMDRTELLKTLAEKRRELREFRFDVAGTQAKDASVKQKTRKEIARILTALNQKADAQ